MSETIKILGIAGSLREGSYNRAILRAAAELAPQGSDIEIFDIAGLPGFSQDDEQDPPAKVADLKQKIRGSDAVIFATPEYNYSVPGVLKNAIDWASRPYGDSAWDGKPAAIMGASVGNIGTARAQYHLRQIMVFLNMHPLNRPEVMVGSCADKFDANGNLTDQSTKDHIQKQIVALVEWTKRLSAGKGKAAGEN
ncbi:MAG TPA: NAD(P)H-dependent oxidoreductase [Pyrinomonadaceae bacterium]|nr:NAD(P)H-dependent oxidoreductase [Pyrinomonadaceae bacterium]